MASGGPAQLANDDNGKVLVLRPVMPGGADLFTDASQLANGVASRSENLDTSRVTMERRRGKKNLQRFITPGTTGASRTFGTTGKYATIPAASQLLIPYGGFAFFFKITAVRTLTEGMILDGQDGADTVPPFKILLSAAGVLTATVNWDGGGSDTLQSSALADGSEQRCLFLFDGLTTTYLILNGVVVATNVTANAAARRPVQTANMTWLVGVHKTAAAVVSLPFAGKVDSMTLLTLRGLRSTLGVGAVFETLRRHSSRAWPAPQMDMVLAHYDFDEASGTTMYDRSQFKNHGTYVGSPTVTAPIDNTAAPVNLITTIKVPGGGWNLVHCNSTLYYEATSPAAV